MSKSDDRVPYQLALRVVGAELDAHAACSVGVLETSTGFILRFGIDLGGRDLGWLQLSIHGIENHKIALRARRRGVFKKGLGSGSRVGRYQDLLRAIGFKLEAVGAYCILIEEVEDQLLVTYQHLRAEVGYVLRKRMLVLGPEEQHTVLEEARRRRGH